MTKEAKHGMEIAALTTFLCAVLLLVGLTIADTYGWFDDAPKTVMVYAPHRPTLAALRPQDRIALAELGWLNYITDNIQDLYYFDMQALTDSHGSEYVGNSWVSDRGLRTATVSSAHSQLEVIKILVHEATHLRGWRLYGHPASHTDTKEMEERVERAWWDRWPAPQPKNLWLETSGSSGLRFIPMESTQPYTLSLSPHGFLLWTQGGTTTWSEPITSGVQTMECSCPN